MSFVTNRVNTLNRNYKRGMEISFIIVLLLIIAAFKFAPMQNKPKHIIPGIPEVIPVQNIEASQQIPKPPPPPNPPVIIAASGIDEIEDIILNSIELNENPPVNPEPPKPPVVNDEIFIFKDLESYPEPIGGMKAIAGKIHYTELARRAGIEGTVTIEAIIDKNGDVTEAKVIRGIGGGLDEIALHAVENTKFIPGMQRDKPVKVRMTIPIKFRLN
jgi:periplasmic protein TonB